MLVRVHELNWRIRSNLNFIYFLWKLWKNVVKINKFISSLESLSLFSFPVKLIDGIGFSRMELFLILLVEPFAFLKPFFFSQRNRTDKKWKIACFNFVVKENPVCLPFFYYFWVFSSQLLDISIFIYFLLFPERIWVR